VYYFGFLVVVAVVTTIWLIKHPLVLVALNTVPLAWWHFGTAGLVAALVLTTMVVATQRTEV
jgi:hypothetical protein